MRNISSQTAQKGMNEAHIHIGDKTYFSALEVALDIFGGKWKTLVLWSLQYGAKRFTELHKLIPGITEKMLSQQLKQLEADRIIQREVFAEVPPRVEYSLTEEGQTILPVLIAMTQWGQHKAEKHAATMRFPKHIKQKSKRGLGLRSS
jgi:DNA-binding HxlR family transcriptional regulator